MIFILRLSKGYESLGRLEARRDRVPEGWCNSNDTIYIVNYLTNKKDPEVLYQGNN